MHFANIFVNTGYVGFPILDAMYGPEGIVYGNLKVQKMVTKNTKK